MMGHRHPFALMGLAALAACGAGDSTSSETLLVVVDRRAPTEAQWIDTTTLLADGPDKALGTDTEGRLTAVIGGMAYVVEGGALARRQRFGDPGAPERLGAVNRIRPRVDGGAWLATDTGLWSTSGLYVRHRPTDLATPRIADVAEQAAGPFAGLWLATPGGTYWISGDTAQRIEGDQPAQRIAVSSDAVALLADGQVRILTRTTEGLVVEAAPFDGAIDVAARGSALYVASSSGLFRWEAGAWTQYTLSADAEVGVTALAVGADDVWVRTASGVMRLSGLSSTATLQRYASVGAGALAVDQLGDVYGEAIDGLSRASSGVVGGDVPTFAVEILPWIDTHCAACHSNQTQDFRDVEVFRGVAESALDRVRTGDMPRCAGSVRCAPEDNLSPEDYSVLERWIRAGLPQ